MLKLTPDNELRAGKQQQDELGYTHRWHTQYYRGVPVEYGTYVVHARNQAIETANGEVFNIKNLSTTPALDEKAALQKALATINALVYKWQIPIEEQGIKAIKNDKNATFYPKGELLITHDSKNNDLGRLAYKFAIYAVKPASSNYVYVDAQTGEVFQLVPVAQHANSPGTAATRYSQTRNITTDNFAGGFRLRETGRGAGTACGSSGAAIETYNMQSGGNFGSAIDFVNGSNNWTGLNNAAKDDAALDAHWGAEATYDYFNTAHCRNSYNGTGGAIKGYVHTDLTAHGFANNDNAYWDGFLEIMVYGDGTSTFSPLTSLDVVAHEIGHGFAQKMVGFDPSKPEANALNEGLSDIWAACVEYSADPNKQTWKIGEDIILTASCLRNLASPNTGSDPRFSPTGGYPDVYNGQYYASNGDSHTNSTVLSHCFYLLAVGGSGTNSAGTAYNITGIGIGKASDVVFRAENNGYITPTAGFQVARAAMIRAATELYGSCSPEVIATANAWYAVGVGLPMYGSLPTPRITATASSGPGEPTTYDFTAPLYAGDDIAYNWYVNNVFFETVKGDNVLRYYFPCRQTRTITCTITSCGGTTAQSNGLARTGGCTRGSSLSAASTSAGSGVDTQEEPRRSALSFAPNPTATELVVQEPNPTASAQTSSPPFEAQLYNGFGQLVSRGLSQRGIVRLDVRNLPNGLYILRAGTGDAAINEHIQITH